MRWAVLLLVPACRFHPAPIAGGDRDGAPLDAPADGATPGIDGAADAPPGPDAPPPDAFVWMCDVGMCSSAGGTCQLDGVCLIEPSSQDRVFCPADHFCEVICDGESNECQSGVDCSMAAGCRIDCLEDQSCMELVTCGGATCEIVCQGQSACQTGGVVCNATESCTVVCNGQSACQTGGVTCTAESCTITCAGQSACQTQGIDCDAATTCDITCCDSSTACSSPMCPAGGCGTGPACP